MADIFEISGRIHSTSQEEVVTTSSEILDESQNKKQSQVNSEVGTALADRYTKAETYSKSQVDNLITTPDVQYVTVATYSALPATGEADTIYRVASWDGSAVDAGKYSEYAWNGSAYQLLAVRSGSLDGVFDISANNLTEGQPTQYANLAAALGTNGANVPVGVRAGGMQVKFIQSSENNYVEYFLPKDEWSDNEEDWQKLNLEEEVSQLSQEVGEFHAEVFGGEFEKELTWSNGYIRKNDGGIASSTVSKYTQPFTLKKGEKVTIGTANSNICIIGTTNAQSLAVGDFVTILQMTDNSGNFETHTYTATEDIKLVLCVKWSDYSLAFEKVDSLDSKVDELSDEIERISVEIAEPVRGTDTDFMELDADYNLFVPADASVGYYINGTNGQLVASSSLAASDFVPVVPNTLYHIQGGEVVLALYYAFYNANKEYISGENSGSGYLTTLQTPNNAQYVRFTGYAATYNDIIFSKNPLSPSDFKYTPKNNVIIPYSIAATELTDVALINAGNIIDRSKLIVGVYIDSADGKQKSTSSVWVASDWCDIDPTKKYSWFKIADFYAAFYDEDKNFILGYSTIDRMPNPVTPPANARYARFTINDTTANAYGVYPSQACWVGADCEHRQPNEYKSYSLPKDVFTERELGSENPCDYTGKEIAVFNKILCIGDSLMYGAENVATGSPYIVAKEPLYNIPTFIKKMSGVETTNAAHSGYSAEQWLAAYADEDLSGHDAVIIQIGVNNWNSWSGEDDPAIETFKTSLGQIIDFAISQNAYNNGGTLKNKPKVFVATQYPAKSYLGITNPISNLNNAIKEVVSGRDDCFLLDMAEYSHSNDNIAFNRGHLTALGYRQVAQDYIGIISKFVNNNLDLFVDVPFVGTPATQYEYSPTQI